MLVEMTTKRLETFIGNLLDKILNQIQEDDLSFREFHISLWPPCCPASEMMEGEAVEIFVLTFNCLLPKVARTALLKKNLYYKPNRALVLPPFKFRRANPTSVPSLDFWLPFYQEKGRSPSAASLNKPAQRNGPISSYNYS